MQDVALDANGQEIKCVLNAKFVVFHMTFRKCPNFGKFLNFRKFQKKFFVRICFFIEFFFFDKNGHSKFIPVFLGKIVTKNLEWPFLAILNFYQSFWEKLMEKIWNSHFGHSEFFLTIFLYISL